MWNLTEQNWGRTSGEWRSRRDFLRIGTLGLTGMTLAGLLLARAGGAE